MRIRRFAAVVAAFVLCCVLGLTSASAAGPTTITVASGAAVSPPPGGTVVDPNVQVSFDNVTWAPAWAADNAGLWPAPLPGSNWVTPGPNREQGYGDPQ